MVTMHPERTEVYGKCEKGTLPNHARKTNKPRKLSPKGKTTPIMMICSSG